MATVLDLPNGDRATVVPFSAARMRDALKILQAKGIRVNLGDADLLNSLEFQNASIRTVLKKYEQKDGDGFKELSEKEKLEFINERTKIVRYIMDKATELAQEEDKEFETDVKN